MYKVVQGSPMIEPIEKYDVDKSENLEAFLEKIKKPVIECDIILKAKVSSSLQPFMSFSRLSYAVFE